MSASVASGVRWCWATDHRVSPGSTVTAAESASAGRLAAAAGAAGTAAGSATSGPAGCPWFAGTWSATAGGGLGAMGLVAVGPALLACAAALPSVFADPAALAVSGALPAESGANGVSGTTSVGSAASAGPVVATGGEFSAGGELSSCGDWSVGAALSTVLVGAATAGQSMVIDDSTSARSPALTGVDGAVAGAVVAESTTPAPPPSEAGVEAVEDVLTTSVLASDPRSAISGTAQALVPASTDTPTAAATIRPAAAGAIRRTTARPHRPGAPGSRPATAAIHTTSTHTRRAHVSAAAMTRMAASAAAPTETSPVVRVGTSISSRVQLAGPGNTTVSPIKPTTHPRSCETADAGLVAVAAIPADCWTSISEDRQSVHLTSFDMG